MIHRFSLANNNSNNNGTVELKSWLQENDSYWMVNQAFILLTLISMVAMLKEVMEVAKMSTYLKNFLNLLIISLL